MFHLIDFSVINTLFIPQRLNLVYFRKKRFNMDDFINTS